MIKIKRYANRKLYYPEQRRYVTLDEIADFLQQGEEVSVTDHLTGADITAQTIAQVLARQEKTHHGQLPHPLLERMVQLSGQTLFAMRESMKAFQDPSAYIESEIRRRLDVLLHENKINASEHHHWGKLLLDPELAPTLLSTEDNQPVATTTELQVLLRQLDRLEAELQSLEAQKKG